MGAHLGDRLTLLSQTVDGAINGLDVEVVGTYTTGIKEFDDRAAVVRIDTAQQILNTKDVSKLVALELVGQAGRFPGLLSWSSPEFEVRSRGPVEVGLDGEALVMQPPLHFTSMPGALRVLTPRRAGLAPAARTIRVTAENLRALGRVAAGR